VDDTGYRKDAGVVENRPSRIKESADESKSKGGDGMTGERVKKGCGGAQKAAIREEVDVGG